ncbi:unnamed protein product [Urochloa humidicola]
MSFFCTRDTLNSPFIPTTTPRGVHILIFLPIRPPLSLRAPPLSPPSRVSSVPRSLLSGGRWTTARARWPAEEQGTSSQAVAGALRRRRGCHARRPEQEGAAAPEQEEGSDGPNWMGKVAAAEMELAEASTATEMASAGAPGAPPRIDACELLQLHSEAQGRRRRARLLLFSAGSVLSSFSPREGDTPASSSTRARGGGRRGARRRAEAWSSIHAWRSSNRRGSAIWSSASSPRSWGRRSSAAWLRSPLLRSSAASSRPPLLDSPGGAPHRARGAGGGGSPPPGAGRPAPVLRCLEPVAARSLPAHTSRSTRTPAEQGPERRQSREAAATSGAGFTLPVAVGLQQHGHTDDSLLPLLFLRARVVGRARGARGPH